MHSYFTTFTILTSAVAAFTLGCGGSVTPTGSGGAPSSSSTSASTATGAGGGASTSATTGAGGATSSSTGAGGSGGSGGSSAVVELGPFTCSGVAVTFAADVAPVFEGCSGAEGCHSLANTFQSPANTYSYLVGKMATGCMDGRLRVAPGDPEHSYVINKLSNHALCSGSPMPKGFGPNGKWVPRPEADVQKIYDWICTGAKND